MNNAPQYRDLFAGLNERTLANGLRWKNEPAEWQFESGILKIVPDARTDFFRPYVGEPTDNACLLYTLRRGDFTAVARVSAKLSGFGDAAALTVRSDAEHWIKLCVERSPAGEVSIVSVVTNGHSDDCNNELLKIPEAELRVSRRGDTFGLQYRAGRGKWRFVRTFGFALPSEVSVGVHAQSPFGEGCSAEFHGLSISSVPVADYRSGE